MKLGNFLDAERASGKMIARNLDLLSLQAKDNKIPLSKLLDEISRIDDEIKTAQREFRDKENEIREEIGV